MNWTFKQWSDQRENVRGMKRITNSLKFWRKRLHNALKNNNVILTLYCSVGKAYPSLERIADETFRINKEIVITGYAKFRNRHFLSITFANVGMRNYVIEHLKKVEGCDIAFLHWVDEVALDYISVDWLSDATDLLLTTEWVENYMDIVSALRETTVLNNGLKCNSGKVIFRGHIKSHVLIDEIPHITIIDGLDCLVYVQGRPVQCFTCSLVGHKASQCKKAYCGTCKQVCFKEHLCVWRRENSRPNMTGINDNSQFFQTQQNSLMESNSDIKVTEDLYAKNVSARNLFWNPKTLVSTEESSLVGQSNLEGMYQDRLGGPSIAEELLKIDWQTEIKSSSCKTEGRKFQREEDAEANIYIRQEATLGDSNFVLVDTSMEESDSEEECAFNLYEHMDSSMAELLKSSEVSRLLVQDSLGIMKLEHMQQSLKSEDVKGKQTEELLTMETEKLQVKVGKDAFARPNSKKCIEQTKKRGNSKKKNR